ncbi:MAG: SCO family protein [Elusimicrobia bacterium]|nr:SCO family protein [Elusimicrobiota bacterium]
MRLSRIIGVAVAGMMLIGVLAFRQEVRRPGADTAEPRVGAAEPRVGAAEPRVGAAEYGSVPDFAFVDQHGTKRRLADFAGKPWVASFIFARCHDECPLIVTRMKELRPKLPAGLAMASVSVDPNDTPADLARFARAQGADWAFMIGKPGEVERFAQGLKLGLSGRGAEDGPLIHSNRLVLVAPDGRIRGYYDPDQDDDARRLVVDAAKL